MDWLGIVGGAVVGAVLTLIGVWIWLEKNFRSWW